MRRLRWIILIALLAAAIGVLLYGIYQGDAQFVLENAKAFCFT